MARERFCPCGSGTSYGACCGPLHAGREAATAEALMRSRYSAFVLLDADYLLRSWHPATRPARLERFKWGLARTVELGLTDVMLHAGFIPEVGDPARTPFLDTLAQVGDLARRSGVTVAFETGQESAALLRRTLDDLKSPNLKVNFDPANMLLYDKGDPIRAVELLGPDIRSVHVKDAKRPKVPGTWGDEVPLGEGEVNIRKFLQTLKKVGYQGPLCVEREVGDQEGRLRDVAHGIRYIRECLSA